jgi:four helix bundle protein
VKKVYENRRESVSERLTDFRQLNVWQKAHKLVLDIYDVTKKFPKEERQELVSRMRAAAMTIPTKIAEGFMRRSPRDKVVSYKGTQEALEEVKYYVILSKDLDYLKDIEELLLSVEEVGRMLTGLVRSVKSS